jgi:hypothetical protein
MADGISSILVPDRKTQKTHLGWLEFPLKSKFQSAISTPPVVLYEQRDLPVLQNRMYATREAALAGPTGDVLLVQDKVTGLIYNQSFRPALVQYDACYQNEQGKSSHFQGHLKNVMGIVRRLLGLDRLVEIGCGKGTFLELLGANGFEISGFDPTYEGNNKRIHKQFFQKGTEICAKGLILRHVLEHVPDPSGFLMDIREANQGQGRIYIEVPCLDWICNTRSWYDIFHEHVNYFRIQDFHRFFGEVLESGRVFGGQYLYVVAELSSLRIPEFRNEEPFLFPSDFCAGIHAAPPPGKGANVVWGGASKGVIFSLLRGRAGFPVDVVVDINPGKQGKFLPGTGLEVQPPAQVIESLAAGSNIYVMNPNYLEEIKAMTQNKFTYIVLGHE